MPNWLKISLFVFIVFAIGAGAALALKVRQLPEAASVENIQLCLESDLEVLREIASDSAALELTFNFDDFDGIGEHPSIAAVADRAVALGLLEERMQVISQNPMVLDVCLAHKLNSHSTRFRFNLSNNFDNDGISPFARSPELGKPAVSRLFGTDKRAVRYAEVVLVDENGADIIFELVLDLELLEQTLPNS